MSDDLEQRDREHAALRRIANAESGHWGRIAHAALRGLSPHQLEDPPMRQWVNDERTVLVRELGGRLEVATRPDVDAVWGPPTRVELEP